MAGRSGTSRVLPGSGRSRGKDARRWAVPSDARASEGTGDSVGRCGLVKACPRRVPRLRETLTGPPRERARSLPGRRPLPARFTSSTMTGTAARTQVRAAARATQGRAPAQKRRSPPVRAGLDHRRWRRKDESVAASTFHVALGFRKSISCHGRALPVHSLVRRPRPSRGGPAPTGSPQPERDDTDDEDDRGGPRDRPRRGGLGTRPRPARARPRAARLALGGHVRGRVVAPDPAG